MNRFDEIIGYDNIKAEVRRYCDVLKNLDKYKALGVDTPRGLILYGDPGVGKSLMAKCLIDESGLKSYIVRKDKPDGEFITHIQEVFKQAKETAPSIIMLDDMDKFANEDDQHKDAEEYVAVQACIDECKGSDVFVIATVNDRWCLPDSLTREGRFNKMIRMDVPAGDDAIKILAHYMTKKKCVNNIDTEEIAGAIGSRSCATLETVINEAGIFAVFAGRNHIGRDDMFRACIKSHFACLIGDSRSGTISEKERQRVAIHEAGHATASEALRPGRTTFVALGTDYSGAVEGITICKKDNDGSQFIKKKERRIMEGLAGMAAIEIATGEHDLGCNEDLERSFDIEKDIVLEDAAHGFEHYRWMYGERSEKHMADVEHVVSSEIKRLYEEIRKLIIKNRPFLDAVTNELMEHDYITSKDITRIRETVGIVSTND